MLKAILCDNVLGFCMEREAPFLGINRKFGSEGEKEALGSI